MSISEAVVDKLNELPADKQREVLEFVDSLVLENSVKGPRHSIAGIWTGLTSSPITDHDIAEARREMWGDFPRDLPE